MKKSLHLSLLFLSLALTAQAQSQVLVAYFSWGGNTQALAEDIQRKTGADLYRIEPAVPYTTDYNTTAYGRARDENQQNARPALKETNKDFSQYDYIFVGCPVWWFDTPMLIHTFLEHYKFEGKTIIPFCTYYTATYQTLNNIVRDTPNAKHLEGLGVRGAASYNANEIDSWLRRIGMDAQTLSVKSVSNTNNALVSPRAVYNLQGKMVRNNGELTGLEPGVYVSNGQKFMVK